MKKHQITVEDAARSLDNPVLIASSFAAGGTGKALRFIPSRNVFRVTKGLAGVYEIVGIAAAVAKYNELEG